jgi:hypothetical protein
VLRGLDLIKLVNHDASGEMLDADLLEECPKTKSSYNQVALSFHERLHHETNGLHSMLFFGELNIDGLGFYFCDQKILDML